MKQMLYREKQIEKKGFKMRVREYLKKSASGWSWERKYPHYKFDSHIKADKVLQDLKPQEGYVLGIEPLDELHYAIIP